MEHVPNAQTPRTGPQLTGSAANEKGNEREIPEHLTISTGVSSVLFIKTLQTVFKLDIILNIIILSKSLFLTKNIQVIKKGLPTSKYILNRNKQWSISQRRRTSPSELSRTQG